MIVNSGLCDEHGLVDVNRYTLQHSKFENVFAFGDCIKGCLLYTSDAADE